MMFIHDCTVYREENGVWKRYELRGVLWQDVQAANIEKSGWKDANTLELFIPHSLGFKAKKKDMVLKGIVDYEIKNRDYDEDVVNSSMTMSVQSLERKLGINFFVNLPDEYVVHAEEKCDLKYWGIK